MSRRVVFSVGSETDLAEIGQYLTTRFSERNAERYVQRIIRECLSLALAPHRGSKRDDVRPGIRTVGFERRATIIFQVKKDEVLILGVYYGGREIVGEQLDEG